MQQLTKIEIPITANKCNYDVVYDHVGKMLYVWNTDTETTLCYKIECHAVTFSTFDTEINKTLDYIFNDWTYRKLL